MVRKVVRIVVIALAVTWLAYLVFANVVLRTRIGPSLVSSERVTVTWAGGWSVLPMRFHLRDAEIDARGPVRPLRLRAARVDGSLALRDLVAGRIAVRDASAERVTHARAGSLLYEGEAQIRGSFTVDREGNADVEHAIVDAHSGFARIDQAPLLEDVRAHLVIDRAGAERTISGGLELDARIASGAFLRPVTTDAADVTGYVRTSLRVVDGVLAPMSTAELRTDPPRSSVVFAVSERGDATMTALLHDVVWKTDALGDPEAARVAELRAKVESPRVRIAAPLEGAVGTLDLRDLEVHARRAPLVGALLDGEPILRGNAHATIGEGAVRGRADLGADDVVVAIGDVQRRGRLDLHVDLRELRPEREEARIAATIDHRWDGGDAALVLEDAALALHDEAGAGGRATLDGSVRIRTSDASFALDALTGSHALPDLVTSIVQTQSLEASADARLETAGSIRLRDIDGHAGPVAIRGRYERASPSEAPAATLLFETGPLAVGVSVLHGRTDLVLLDARAWFERALAGEPRGS